MRSFIIALSLLTMSQFAFAEPAWKSEQRNGPQNNYQDRYHDDGRDFMHYKKENMERYRNNEMVHNCIRNAETKRDIGLCIKDNKAEQKSERYQYKEEDRRYEKDREHYRERDEMHDRRDYRERMDDDERDKIRDKMHDRMKDNK